MLIDSVSSQRFSEIFPHMENILQCGLITFDPNSKAMHWSRGVYSIFGLDTSLRGTEENFYRFVNPENIDLVKSSFKKTIETKTPFQIEFSITNGKGLHKRLHAENYIISDDAGQMKEYIGVIKDVTESYYYKRALEQKITQLDKSNRNLQDFVYVASHDLQEPLRKISTFTERLNNKFETALGPEGSMFVKRIMSATKSMQTLLEDLLNFSSVSFDEKKFENVSIKKCINSVLTDLEVKIEETKTVVTCDNFPEVEVYPSQIKQLFINLIGNGIKFRKADTPAAIHITHEKFNTEEYLHLPLAKGTQYIKINISDNGIGFEQEFAERIFTIFQRLNGKSEYAGSGVGLAICKKIVDNHHGFICANSEIGKGAVFTILLPYQQD
jgi:PAS domain S-box-containing protein